MPIKTIQRGDTLSQLVATYNKQHATKLSVADVAKANGLKDANKIVAGKTLVFPDAFDSKTVKAEQTKPGTTVQNRPQEKLPQSPVVPQQQKPTTPVQQKPTTTVQQKPTTTVQQKPTMTVQQKPETTVQQKPTTTVQQKPETTVQQKPTTTVQQKPKTTVQQKPETTVQQKPETPVQQKPETTVQQKPTTPVQQKPTTPVQQKPETTVQQQPTTTVQQPATQQAPAKTTLSLSEFLAANKDKTLSVDSLRRNGVDAARADLNGDGAIQGDKELGKLFSVAEKADKNGDNTVADLGNATVARNFDRIGQATTLKAAPYSKTDLENVKAVLTEGSTTNISTLDPAAARAAGLSPGSTSLRISASVDESKGRGNRINAVDIYRDAKTGQYFKELHNDADGKNTGIVPLTAEELRLVKKLGVGNARWEVGTPQEKMMAELFGVETGA